MNETMNECVIEWLKGDKTACVTMPNNTRLKNKIVKLAQINDRVRVILNEDGSICAEIPVEWVKINPKRVASDSEKERLREMARKRKA